MKHEVTSLNTKRTLAESLKTIMKKKPFSKITISEIIADCGVNRKTFYYHFEDIYALLKWMFENEAIEVIKNFDLLVDYEDAILFVMDYVEKNEYIINCVHDAIGRNEIKRFFFADFNEIAKNFIESVEKETGVELSPDYRAFLSEFYTEALVGVLFDWVKHRTERGRAQTVKYIADTIRLSLTGILSENKDRQ